MDRPCSGTSYSECQFCADTGSDRLVPIFLLKLLVLAMSRVID